jgi:predicted GNAT family acetyltransferase
LPGVIGPSTGSARFASAWGELTGATTELVFRQRIYRALAARTPAGVPGAARAVADGDRPLLLEWVDAFFAEALPDQHPETAEEHLARRDGDPDAGYLLWEASGVPVSMAGWSGPTPNGIRIGPVYTPPDHRRNGYGGAVTAALTYRLLRGGRRFCFLFTDLANPTSNGIYRQIGYEPVSDVDQYRFGADA